MAAVTICSDFGLREIVSHCSHCFSIYHRVMGPDAKLAFWILSFKLASSLFSFTFIKRLFSSSSLSAIRVVSSAYLILLIFLLAILIPACVSSRVGSPICCLGLSNYIFSCIWNMYDLEQLNKSQLIVLHENPQRGGCEVIHPYWNKKKWSAK